MVELHNFIKNGNNWSRNKHFRLTNDIPDTLKFPIGTDTLSKCFQGNFSGGGFSIILNLNIPNQKQDTICSGLFTRTNYANISGVTIKGSIVDTLNQNKVNVRTGGIVGLATNTSISHCKNYANIIGSGLTAGIVGMMLQKCQLVFNENYGNITHRSSGSVTVRSANCGGIAAWIEDTDVRHCSNAGSIFITSFGNVGGGVIGYSSTDCRVEYCINIGSVIATIYQYLGGIIGMNYSNCTIQHNFNSGFVYGKEKSSVSWSTGNGIGGIIGHHRSNNSSLRNNFNSGVVKGEGTANFGGVVGEYAGGTISNNFYDKQMCLYGGINGKDEAGRAEGFLTKEVIGNNLLSKLGTANWVYSDNLYPTLKALENEIISKIARSPAYLDDTKADFDRQNNVRDCFIVNLENNIEWTKAFNRLRIEGNKVYLDNLGNDTLYAGIGNIKKTIPLTVNKLCKEPPHYTCTLTLVDIDGNGKIVETKYECGNKVEINISLTDTCCIKFIHWIDNFGKIISTKPQDTITLISDSVLIAIYEKIDSVTVTSVLIQDGIVVNSYERRYECGKSFIHGARLVYPWEFLGWAVEPDDGDYDIINEDTISSITIFPLCKDYTVTASYKKIELPPVLDVKFYIRASKHPLTDPTRRNYRIPIFIKADEYVSGSMIDSLVIEIDRRIFYPKRVDNGDMSLHFKDTVIKMTFENVTVPELKANEEKVLLTIRGDVLLGEIDSSEIKIDTVNFSEQLSEKPDLIHGFITLDICDEGANRLVWFDYSPEVIVKNNPVTGGILELQCKTIERGSYSLEIVDMLGKSETVREFTVSASGKRIFDFEIPISNFSSGAYFIIMNTPTAKYSTGFVIQ